MCHRFQHFGDFDHTHIGGPTKLAQWTGKVKRHYNAFANHANQAISLSQHRPWPYRRMAALENELVRAVEEVKQLARLRSYELNCLEDEFDVNDDGPGSADFICSFACEFLYAAYTARTEFVVWKCLRTDFKYVNKPKGVISAKASVISNRGDDEHAWHDFCDIVEDALHIDEFANRVLGCDAHSQFLAHNDETLYCFQQSWMASLSSSDVDWCAPIFADSPDYGYHGRPANAQEADVG